jgi:hypothetical protein
MANSGLVDPVVEAPGGAHNRRVVRRVAGLMVVEAVTLAVASALHLSGQVTGRSSPFDADHAGIAEAIIGAVLVAGAAGMMWLPGKARVIGIIVNGLAIAGFLLGLSMTVRGGHLPDIGYHLVVLPALIGSLVALLRS